MKFPKLSSPAILSPMAGVTDVAFRALARGYGAGLTYTEFVSSAAIVRGNTSSLRMIKTDPSEKPVAVQLFGSNVEEVVEAARFLEERFDIIDVNCGCPAWKVIKTGAGSELLKKPEGIAEFINKLASAVSKPVTLKIRKGIDEGHVNAVEVAKLAEDAGAAAIAIHGRTQKQHYSGRSNNEFIKNIKKELTIPVIANGDIRDEKIAKHVLEYTQCDGLMIGRAAIGNPHIFRRIEHYLDSGELLPSQSLSERLVDFFEYEALCRRYKMLVFNDLMAKAMWFTKGIKNSRLVRVEINKAKDIDSILGIMKSLGDKTSDRPVQSVC